MGKFNYTIADNTVKVAGFEDALTVLDLSTWKPEIINYYRALLGHRRDLEYAEAYLNQMFFQADTSLIDGALINSAVQLLVKCFSNPSNMGRCCLDRTKVFRKHAEAIGEKDLTGLFSQFYDARNTVICHDQYNYKENIVGMVVNKTTGIAEDIADLTIRTGYLYKQNQQNLLRLVKITLDYVANHIGKLKNKRMTEYNESFGKPELHEITCENIPKATSW